MGILKAVLIVSVGFLLALILPTPVLIALGGGWLLASRVRPK